MKLSLVRSLDAGDPACTLGPALPRPTKEPPLGGWLPFTAHEKAGPVAHAKEYLLRCGSPLRAQDVDVFSECGGGTVIGWR